MDLPQEFLERMEVLLGDEFPAFLRSYEEPRRFGLRVNTLKISVEEFLRIAPFHLTPIPWTDNGFFYEKEDAPSRHPFYYAGLYYLQEPSAMTPAQILPVSPGDRVLDLCAAPGGKATALAAKLQGSGLLVANDVSASRAKALLKNLEISGVTNSFVTNTMPARLAEQFPEFFDRILVDAPCSGEGMFRKDAAAAKAWSPDKVRDCAKTQKEIVLQAVSMLRPGGLLLYSTCTFSREENEQVIAYLLENRPEMELIPIPMAREYPARSVGCHPAREYPARSVGCHPAREYPARSARWSGADGFCGSRPSPEYEDWCVRIFPHRMAGEGHFMALMRKRASGMTAGGSSHSAPAKKRRQTAAQMKGSSSETEMETVRSFLQDMLRKPGERGAARWSGAMEIHGTLAYYVQENPGITGSFPFLRNGLYLGEVRKGRFEPSQAFAMALRAEDCTSVLDFDCTDERILRYLRGETIEADDSSADAAKGQENSKIKISQKDAQKNGWKLVCVNGYPLGWGKLVNGTLKNKYHPGWRMRTGSA